MAIDIEEAHHAASLGDAAPGQLAAEFLAGLPGRQARQFAAQRLDLGQTIQSNDAAETAGGILFQRLRAGDAQQRQQNVGHQRGPQSIEGRPNRAVDPAGYRQDITGDKSRDGQQHARPGKILGGSEYRSGIFDQSHRGQEAVHRPVQRIGIAADGRRFDALVWFHPAARRPLPRRLWGCRIIVPGN